ncbi:hypothetical protein BDW74DRAFT_178250 [Aspergillus multicolor]|uniref:uncharacterized protein n=1 Tax=Aspergillus multicolor TaxID=41759 RepID=UPI003CCD580E
MPATKMANLGVAYQLGDQPTNLILPQELLDMINAYIVGGRPGKQNYFGRVPAQLCLVNSTWRRIFTPLLYATFRFTGNVNNLLSLWSFIRTLYQNPELGPLVKELTLTTWHIHEPLTLESKDVDAFCDLLNIYGGIPDGQSIACFRENLALVMGVHGFLSHEFNGKPHTVMSQLNTALKERYATALYAQNRIWFDCLFELLVGSADLVPAMQRTLLTGMLNSGYQIPLAVVAIALCPNLVRLNYNFAHAGRCIFFHRLLSLATGSRSLPEVYLNHSPMGNLEVLNIGGQTTESGDFVSVMISDCVPYWLIPSLKSLSILNADEMRYPLLNSTCQFSGIEHLTIEGKAVIPHLGSLFAQMLRLSKLSLHLNVHYAYRGDDVNPTGPAQWPGIWEMLSGLKERLVYLELCQDAFVFSEESHPTLPFFETSGEDGAPLEAFCPPLKEFTKLRHLHIPVFGLYGHDCEHEHCAKLASHLPPNVESLAIYGASEPWVPFYFPDFDRELEAVITTASPNPTYLHTNNNTSEGNLCALIYDGINSTNKNHGALVKRVSAAAAKHGALFIHPGEEYLLQGGELSTWGLLNMKMQFEWVDELVASMDPGRVVPRGIVVGGGGLGGDWGR